jgi:uncharacterized protein
MFLNTNFERPEINYPCEWSYKVIGTDVEMILAAIDDASCGIEYDVTPSNVSKNEKYYSLDVTLEVPSEFMRDFIFQKLKDSEHIKIVL